MEGLMTPVFLLGCASLLHAQTATTGSFVGAVFGSDGGRYL